MMACSTCTNLPINFNKCTNTKDNSLRVSAADATSKGQRQEPWPGGIRRSDDEEDAPEGERQPAHPLRRNRTIVTSSPLRPRALKQAWRIKVPPVRDHGRKDHQSRHGGSAWVERRTLTKPWRVPVRRIRPGFSFGVEVSRKQMINFEGALVSNFGFSTLRRLDANAL